MKQLFYSSLGRFAQKNNFYKQLVTLAHITLKVSNSFQCKDLAVLKRRKSIQLKNLKKSVAKIKSISVCKRRHDESDENRYNCHEMTSTLPEVRIIRPLKPGSRKIHNRTKLDSRSNLCQTIRSQDILHLVSPLTQRENRVHYFLKQLELTQLKMCSTASKHLTTLFTNITLSSLIVCFYGFWFVRFSVFRIHTNYFLNMFVSILMRF